MRKKRIATIVVVVVSVLAAVFRAVVGYHTPISPETHAVLDDGLLISHGLSLVQSEWLGQFGEVTLAKNPGYPLVLATFCMTGVSYQAGFLMLLGFACVVAVQSLRPLVPSFAIRSILFVVLYWTPVFFTSTFYQRVYRNGIVVVFALIVFSAFIAVYLRRRERLIVLLPWSLLAGVSLGMLSIILESGVWALLFACVSTATTLVLTCLDAIRHARRINEAAQGPKHMRALETASKESPVRKWQMFGGLALRMLTMVLPLVICTSVQVAICEINRQVYGVSLRNDRYEGEFARVCANMVSIDDDRSDIQVWVSNDALDAALAASPTLATMEPELRESWEWWQDLSSGYGITDDKQVLGGYAFWSLRSSYAAHGGYRDVAETQHYWATVADELEASFSSGELRRKGGIYFSDSIQPMPENMLKTWISSTLELVVRYVWCEYLEGSVIRPMPSTYLGLGWVDEEMEARTLLGNNTIFSVEGEIYQDYSSEVAQPWLMLDNALGNTLVTAYRIILVITVLAAPCLLFFDIRSRTGDGGRTALIVLGLFLSAFTLAFSSSWLISFLTPAKSALSAGGESLAYSGSVYALFSLTECIVLGRVSQIILDYKSKQK